MIPSFWCCKCQYRWRKEHGLIIWVCYEEAYALTLEVWERTACDLRGVEPCCSDEDGYGEREVELHFKHFQFDQIARLS